MSSNATVTAALVTGILLLLTSLLVPIVTRKANKAGDASEAARRSAETAKLYTDSAIALVGGVEKQLADANRKCDDCLGELEEMRARDTQRDKVIAAMKAREARRDRSLDAVHAALLEIVPLLAADGDETRMVRAAIRTVSQARYED